MCFLLVYIYPLCFLIKIFFFYIIKLRLLFYYYFLKNDSYYGKDFIELWKQEKLIFNVSIIFALLFDEKYKSFLNENFVIKVY